MELEEVSQTQFEKKLCKLNLEKNSVLTLIAS